MMELSNIAACLAHGRWPKQELASLCSYSWPTLTPQLNGDLFHLTEYQFSGEFSHVAQFFDVAEHVEQMLRPILFQHVDR